MSDQNSDVWDELWDQINRLQTALQKSRAIHVNTEVLRSQARAVVQSYFRTVRSGLERSGIDPELLKSFDAAMQEILRLSNTRSSKRSFLQIIRTLRKLRPAIELNRELAFATAASGLSAESGRTRLEGVILDTLDKLLPTAALSYEQALIDLQMPGRKSYRGTAVELRETLRELLDHLAPDSAVLKSPGFQLEKNQSKPTMKQKVRFILKSRGVSSAGLGPPEDSTTSVEALTASLARSTYDRGSLSTHVATTKQEVHQVKLYVDVVLAELLQVPHS